MTKQPYKLGETARELLLRCDEEIGDAGRAAVLQSEFVRALDAESAITLLDEGQFCRAFALAAAQLAVDEPRLWPRDRLLQLADMCYHNGDSREGDELVEIAGRS